MIARLEKILTEVRERITSYAFSSKEEEIIFFKEQKPEILSRLLFLIKSIRLNLSFQMVVMMWE